MILQDVLKFAEDLVFKETGEGLNNLQKAVIKGAYNGKTYNDIGQDNNCSAGHVSDTAYKLWKLLSNLLDENIDKSNITSVLERYVFSNTSCIEQTNLIKINNNQSSDTIQIFKGDSSRYKKNNSTPLYLSNKYNLKELPKASSFYGRNQELTQLQEWFKEENINLILLYGLKGIGKTSLIIELINIIKNQFNFIAYFDLKFNYSLEKIEKRILELCLSVEQNFEENIELFPPSFLPDQIKELSLEPTERRTKIIELLRENRCLIIFDHAQILLEQENKQNSQDFKLFFQQVAQLDHQSYLLLLSRENFPDIVDLSLNYSSIQLLKLQGLDHLSATQLLEEKGLKYPDTIEKLINLYQCHPAWLKQIINVFEKLLNSDYSLILNREQIFLTDLMKQEFKIILDKLSPSDQQILITLANSEQNLTVLEIFKQLSLSVDEVINGLQRLGDRCLIEKIDNYFQINKIIKNYLTI